MSNCSDYALLVGCRYDGCVVKTTARDYEEIALYLRCDGHVVECCDRNGRRCDGNLDGSDNGA
jgi:hypothetical protein